MVDHEKPKGDRITLNLDLTAVERASFITYTLGGIERDEPLRRRLGEARCDQFKKFVSLLIGQEFLDKDAVRGKGIDPEILSRKARTMAASFMIRIRRS